MSNIDVLSTQMEGVLDAVKSLENRIDKRFDTVDKTMREGYVSKVEFVKVISKLDSLDERMKEVEGGISWAAKTAIGAFLTGIIGAAQWFR